MLELSAHFVIYGPGETQPDGTIVQLLDTDWCCYAQGAGNYPPIAYIGMEFAGQPTTPMTLAQLDAGAEIDAWASKEHGFPLVGVVEHGTPGCTTHCTPSGLPDPAWGGHPCPGMIRLGQVPYVVARAIQINGDEPPDHEPTTEVPVPVSNLIAHQGTWHCLQVSSGTLWNFWAIGTPQKTGESVLAQANGTGVAITLPDQTPQYTQSGGYLLVTVEDAKQGVWYFVQDGSSPGWSAQQVS